MPRRLNYTVGENGEKNCKEGFKKTKGGRCYPQQRAKPKRKFGPVRNTATGQLDRKGNMIHQGPRGGHYVFHRGRRIYYNAAAMQNVMADPTVNLQVKRKKKISSS
jgi:hypothetical protein